MVTFCNRIGDQFVNGGKNTYLTFLSSDYKLKTKENALMFNSVCETEIHKVKQCLLRSCNGITNYVVCLLSSFWFVFFDQHKHNS